VIVCPTRDGVMPITASFCSQPFDVGVFERLRPAQPPLLRVLVGDAIECMVSTLSRTTEDALLCSTVFGSYVGPCDCHMLSKPDRLLPSDEVLLYVARRPGAKTVLFGSQSWGPIQSIHYRDTVLTGRLLSAGGRNGIRVLDHVVVSEGLCFAS
jgi:hypothetical protein